MVCYSPIKAYPSKERNPATGKRPMVFSGKDALIEGHLQTLPCGGCIGCRIDRAEAWAIRAHHEARMHQFEFGTGSAFLTLTFDREHLPASNSVSLAKMQEFLKALRYRVKVPIRYLLCGEYGELRGRAHYHVLVFGYDFPDRRPWRKTRNGHQLFKSELLSLAWTEGEALVGNVSYQSARYVGSYVLKKRGGEDAEAHYTRQSPVDGEWYRVEPEFASMSLKPGLGESWFRKFSGDVFPSDQCMVDGHPKKPPRYYEKLYGEEAMKPIKRERRRRHHGKSEDRTPERLSTREEFATLKARKFSREVE